MRFLPALTLAVLTLAPVSAWAQATPPATPPNTLLTKNPLVITTPPGSVVAFEADGREGDLLGIVKSLVTAVEKSIESAPSSKSNPAQTSQAASFLAPFAGFLEGKKFSDILKDVTHVHVVIYRKTAAADAAPTAVPASTAVAAAPMPLDYLAFHEKFLTGEGGRRLLYANDGGHYLVTGFDAPRGMAVIIDDGSRVTVVRTEGIIDFKVAAGLLLGFAGVSAAQETTAAAPAVAAPATKATPKKPVKKAPAAKPRG